MRVRSEVADVNNRKSVFGTTPPPSLAPPLRRLCLGQIRLIRQYFVNIWLSTVFCMIHVSGAEYGVRLYEN